MKLHSHCKTRSYPKMPLKQFITTLTFSWVTRKNEVRREAIAFGIRAEINNRRWDADEYSWGSDKCLSWEMNVSGPFEDESFFVIILRSSFCKYKKNNG